MGGWGTRGDVGGGGGCKDGYQSIAVVKEEEGRGETRVRLLSVLAEVHLRHAHAQVEQQGRHVLEVQLKPRRAGQGGSAWPRPPPPRAPRSGKSERERSVGGRVVG